MQILLLVILYLNHVKYMYPVQRNITQLPLSDSVTFPFFTAKLDCRKDWNIRINTSQGLQQEIRTFLLLYV